jgi:hypothetical protein
MEPPEVVVVGETPSLGRSVTDLLDSAGVRTRFVEDLRREPPERDEVGRLPIVIVASSGYSCATARQRSRGEVPNVTLVVVGSLDPALAGAANLCQVSLPLEPGRFLEMIRALLGAPGPIGGPPSGPHRGFGTVGMPRGTRAVEGRVSGLPTFK